MVNNKYLIFSIVIFGYYSFAYIILRTLFSRYLANKFDQYIYPTPRVNFFIVPVFAGYMKILEMLGINYKWHKFERPMPRWLDNIALIIGVSDVLILAFCIVFCFVKKSSFF